MAGGPATPANDLTVRRQRLSEGERKRASERRGPQVEGMTQMTKLTDQQRAANYMGAIAHLLGGRPGAAAAFIERVELILSGDEPDALQLMQFRQRSLVSGRPVLWVHVAQENPTVPSIGLVVPVDDQVRIFENCMLWIGAEGGRARLVPDSFDWGAYRFDDELRLRHVAKAPAKSFDAAKAGMARAYRRLLKLEVEQIERGGELPLPELARAA